MGARFRQFTQGLGRFGENLQNALYPIPEEIARDLDPETLNALRRQANLQLGLGMLAAKDRGAGLGQGVNQSLQQSQQGLTQGLGQAYIAKRSQREDERLRIQDDRYQRREDLYDERYRQDRLDRVEDVAYRNSQAAAASRRADVDDRRLASMYGLNLEQYKRQQEKELEVENLTNQLAELRTRGLGDDNNEVRALLAKLERFGVNAYLPQVRDDDPFGFKEAARLEALKGGAATGGPPQLPPP